jgi:hypothetical protein
MDLTVVIPTRDREQRLRATLEVLGRQRLEGAEAEVVVVDNGALAEELPVQLGPIAVRSLSEPGVGVGLARNAALAAAAADVVLFLGDDTPPAAEDLLLAHIRLHRARPEPGYAVLGRIEWDPALEVTDFMRWLPRAGFQNAFDGLDPGPVSAATTQFSSHASIKRSLLQRAGGFDERFPFYFEHVDLGIRLERAGIHLDYHPELLVHHDHPQTLDAFIERMRGVGAAARMLRSRWPEIAPAEVRGPSWKWRLYPAADRAARVSLRLHLPRRARERAWGVRLMKAYADGYTADS